MRVWAVVPARAGSKRLPGKNLEPVAGVSLVAHAVRHAGEAGVDAIIVTSDSRQILRAAGEAAGDMRAPVYLCERPGRLAHDDTAMLPVLEHAYLWAAGQAEQKPDALLLLQPTSPLRTPGDIVSAINIMRETNADCVVSVCAAADDLAFKLRHAGRLERLPNVVVENGAIYLLRRTALVAGLGWYGGELYAYPMPKDRSLDIDTAQDLAIARMLMEQK